MSAKAGRDRGEERSAQDLVGDVQHLWSEVSERLDLAGRIERNPIGTVLAAAGIGFVLGGGLFRPLAGRVIGAGLRLALVPLLRDQLVQLAEPYLSGVAAGAGGDAGFAAGEQEGGEEHGGEMGGS